MSNYRIEILKHPVDKLALLEWPSMTVLEANEEFCHYFNLTKAKRKKKVFLSLVWEDVPREKQESIVSTVDENGFISFHDEQTDRWIQITKVKEGNQVIALARVLDIPTNKKIIEKELQESEQRFKSLAAVASEGICFIQEGTIVDANDQLARIYGYENGQAIISRKLNELMTIQDIQLLLASAEISAVNRNDVRATDVNGRMMLLEITGSFVQFKSKRTLALVINDVSSRKRAEQALHQSLESFQRLLEDSPNGVVILTEGKIQYLNQAACKLLGAKEEDEVFGDSFESFIEDSFKHTMQNDLQIIREGGEVFNKEIRMKALTGEIIDVEIKPTLTVYENRPSIQITLNNITDRNKLLQEQIRVRFVEEINAALKAEIEEHRATQIKLDQQQKQTLEQTAKIESIFNSTENIMMWTIDHDYEITALNTNFIANMKASFGEDVEKKNNIMSMLKQHVDQDLYQGQLQAFTNGFKGRPQQFELPLKNTEGDTIWWQCFLNPVHVNGKFQELSCLVYDNTDRKEIDRKIRDSLKEKEVLLKEVHHRVKNNLQVISSILNLQSSYVDDPKTLEILRESQQRIKSMSFIHETIYRTSDFSRLEFMDYLKTIISNLIQSYRSAKTRVDFVSEMESVGLNLDQAIPCGLIVNELVSNSLKYAFKGREHGKLTVRLNEEDGVIMLAVMDDGIGLPADFAFEKNNSLGIQLVYALLDQIDATVKVDQTDGTQFFISFKRK
jgi:PAS domain S-box-containing protein